MPLFGHDGLVFCVAAPQRGEKMEYVLQIKFKMFSRKKEVETYINMSRICPKGNLFIF